MLYYSVPPHPVPDNPTKKNCNKKRGSYIYICRFWYKTRSYLLLQNSHCGEARGCKWNYNNCGILQIMIGYRAQPRLIRLSVCLSVCLFVRPSVHSSVCPSVHPSVRPSICLSVRACRLGIERKMAQAQQIRSIILQNHEYTWIVNQELFQIKYMNKSNIVNNMKLMILEKIG